MSVSFTFYPIIDFPQFSFTSSLIYHGQISCNPLCLPLWFWCKKINAKTVIFPEHFPNPLRFCFFGNCHLFASNKTRKNCTGLDVSYVDMNNGEAMQVWGQGMYGKSFYLQLNFIMNLKLLFKKHTHKLWVPTYQHLCDF